MKTIEWFKLQSRTIHDSKLRLLAREDRWNFVAVLCLKAEGEIDSDAPLLERRMAVALELTAAEAVEAKRRLVEVGLIDENWQPVAWDKNQPSLDNTAADRKRRQREREKGMSQNVTRDARDGHATELEEELEEEKDLQSFTQSRDLPLEAALTHGRSPGDSQSEAEPERQGDILGAKTAKTPKTVATRGTRLGDFPLTPARRKVAEQQGITDNAEIHATHRVFCNHWRSKAGREACKVDWDLTWENWCIRDGKEKRAKASRKAFQPTQPERPRAPKFPA